MFKIFTKLGQWGTSSHGTVYACVQLWTGFDSLKYIAVIYDAGEEGTIHYPGWQGRKT